MTELEQAREARDNAAREMLKVTANGYHAVDVSKGHWKLHALNDELVAALEARVAELEARQTSADTVLSDHADLLHLDLTAYGKLSDSLRDVVGRVLKRCAALEAGLKPFASAFVGLQPKRPHDYHELIAWRDGEVTTDDLEHAYDLLHAPDAPAEGQGTDDGEGEE